ncbi:MAG: cytochrome c3 family protein, partial [Thermodesulfobacteriota bacterium]
MKRAHRRKRTVSLLLVTAGLLVFAAAMHLAVPAPSAAPRKGCIDCHAGMVEKMLTGNVHAPVKAKDCDACHLPHGLIGGAFLRQEVPLLCQRCHEAVMRPAVKPVTVHAPFAKGTCTSCHAAHNSTQPRLLKAAQNEGCYGCHNRGDYEKAIVHAPVKQGCATCHAPHSSGHPALLKEAADFLCLKCHQTDGQKAKAAHHGQEVRSGCLGCHNPHSTEKRGLVKATFHQPVAAGKCTACHGTQPDGRLAKVADAALCVKCHKQDAALAGKIHRPVGEGKCLECHAVHASDHRGLLAKRPTQLCLDCHKREDGGHQTQTQTHAPYRDGNCLACHAAHGKKETFGLKASGAALCASCHESAKYGGAGGHAPAAKGECRTCHQPHVADSRALLTKKEEALCLSCHKELEQQMNRFSVHRPFAGGECSRCHNPHQSGGAPKLLRERDTTTLCVGCHESLK